MVVMVYMVVSKFNCKSSDKTTNKNMVVDVFCFHILFLVYYVLYAHIKLVHVKMLKKKLVKAFMFH